MASIALYDIDFWHAKKSRPNFELMKVFNYYYSQNHIVNFVKPQEPLDKYNKVFFFFESEKERIPRGVKIQPDKSQCYGYGFYHSYTPLKEEIRNTPINFTLYDLQEDKIKNLAEYKKIKRSSLIRVEDNDTNNFNSDYRHIFFVDHNFLYQASGFAAIKEYQDFNLNFYYPLIANDLETAEKFRDFSNSFKNRTILVNFDYTKEFLEEYSNYNYSFLILNTEGREALVKSIKTILLLKNLNKSVRINRFAILKEYESLGKWYLSGGNDSYYNYIKDNKNLLKEFNLKYSKDSEIRLLLKQNPKSLNHLTFTI